MNNNSFFHLISSIFSSIFHDKIFFHVTNSLSQVILLILFLRWMIKKISLVSTYKKNVLLKIRDKISVGPHQSIIVLEVQEIKLVLGITEKKISYLYTLPPYLIKEKLCHKSEKSCNKSEKGL